MRSTSRDPSREGEIRYVVVVPPSEPTLYAYLSRRFDGLPRTEVLFDRRRNSTAIDGRRDRWGEGPDRPVDRRQALARVLSAGVVVARAAASNVEEYGPHTKKEAGGMQEMETLGERQRVDQWLEESQYLLGRLIPGLLDDRDRAREKVAAIEAECDRLRLEAAELRQELGQLRAELEWRRGKDAAAAALCSGLIEQLGELQKPIHELYRHIQAGYPSMNELQA
jgi:hypothetical protein